MSTTQSAVRIVEDECEIASNGLAASIVLATDLPSGQAIEALKSAEARTMALGFASSKGINRPGVNDSPDVYPVIFDGTPLQDAQEKAAKENKPADHPDCAMTGYRCRIKVVGNPV